jgi:hypothetical protein
MLLLAPAAGAGLADRYPGDVGIENDPAVVFTADFEQATVADVASRWDDSRNTAGMSLVPLVPPASLGLQGLQMTAVMGQDTGGHLYKLLAPGYDRLYARFYLRFPPDHHPVHHFVHMGGYNPPTPWPQGGAGERPNGDERFTSGIEPLGAAWNWDFYSYWMHMRGNPGGPEFWGNIFNPDPPVPVVRGEWICVELMMAVNNPPDSYNGEQAFWINGELGHHLGEGFPNGYWVWDKFYPDPNEPPFEGFQWRMDSDLRLNFLWLLYYMTDGPGGQTDTVVFDDLVVATEYIGPISSGQDPLLKAVKDGTDVGLSWTDTGAADYSLVRSLEPDLTDPQLLYQGPAAAAVDGGAVTQAVDYYYAVH